MLKDYVTDKLSRLHHTYYLGGESIHPHHLPQAKKFVQLLKKVSKWLT
jgi:hypothetical protein